jgi:LCP family protein required for cell wall assembly
MRDEPVVWDPTHRRFVTAERAEPQVEDPTRVAPAPQSSARAGPSERRHVVIGPEYVGRTPGGSTAPAREAPTTNPSRSRPSAAPPRPPAPPSAPRTRRAPAPAPRDPRRTRRRVGRIVVAVLVVLVLLVAGLFFFGWWQFSRIDRVDVGNALSPGGGKGTNYLIVGSDSRQGISSDSPNSGAFLGGTVSGERTDTIMVLRVEGSKSYLLSIPRDLWVTNPATGEAGRINATYQSGPAALITAVRNLGIPVHHYLEINFVSFAELVDAVGGITIEFPHPARDTHSGLDVPQAGKNHLDGTEALAYVRSRYYEELIDGRWVADPTADLGRVQRQRAFLQALMGKVTGTKNPLALMSISTAMSGGMRIDDELTYFDALGLAWHLRGGFNPESVTLPVTPTTRGGAAVLDLKPAEAAPLTQQFSA